MKGKSGFSGWVRGTKKVGLYQWHTRVVAVPRAEDVIPTVLPYLLVRPTNTDHGNSATVHGPGTGVI